MGQLPALVIFIVHKINKSTPTVDGTIDTERLSDPNHPLFARTGCSMAIFWIHNWKTCCTLLITGVQCARKIKMRLQKKQPRKTLQWAQSCSQLWLASWIWLCHTTQQASRNKNATGHSSSTRCKDLFSSWISPPATASLHWCRRVWSFPAMRAFGQWAIGRFQS